MKIGSYHQAYDQLTECAREADAMGQPEIVEMIEEARAQLHRAWSHLVELEEAAKKNSVEPTP